MPPLRSYGRWYFIPPLALSLAAGLLMVVAGCRATANAGAEAMMTQKEVEERLTCQCGCGLTVHTCNHLQCSFAVPVKKDIADSLAAGQTGEAILARYLAEYGEKILSSPVRRGFNLLAWLLPYAAVMLGAVAIVVVLKRFAPVVADDDGDRNYGGSVSSEQRKRLERELKDMDS